MYSYINKSNYIHIHLQDSASVCFIESPATVTLQFVDGATSPCCCFFFMVPAVAMSQWFSEIPADEPRGPELLHCFSSKGPPNHRSHEHYVELCVPWLRGRIAASGKDDWLKNPLNSCDIGSSMLLIWKWWIPQNVVMFYFDATSLIRRPAKWPKNINSYPRFGDNLQYCDIEGRGAHSVVAWKRANDKARWNLWL